MLIWIVFEKLCANRNSLPSIEPISNTECGGFDRTPTLLYELFFRLICKVVSQLNCVYNLYNNGDYGEFSLPQSHTHMCVCLFVRVNMFVLLINHPPLYICDMNEHTYVAFTNGFNLIDGTTVIAIKLFLSFWCRSKWRPMFDIKMKGTNRSITYNWFYKLTCW